MAHFAKLDENNNVLWVTPLDDSICNDDEATGVAYLTEHHNWPYWKKTSYNTFANEHKTGKTAYRGNYASVGHVYDPDLDIFKQKNKPYPSWTMNNTTGLFEAPVARPSDDADNKDHVWDESSQSWVVLD